MADNTITVAFEADTSGLAAGISQANNFLDGFSASTNKALGDMGTFFDDMQSVTGQVLKGVLQGTQTWQQAIARALGGVMASMANSFLWMQVHSLENELALTEITQEGNTARTASNQAAAIASVGAQAEGAVAAIMNDAKQVFSGIFAFLAPTMGPAASGPAAAGSATVAALASGITYAENGAWNIPSNTLAYLHAGEMVVPQSFASNLRGGSGFGGGGDNYTININAIDTQTGAQFLRNNASVIASTISSQVRNFNRNLPAWKN
jgi:hypothetical protein